MKQVLLWICVLALPGCTEPSTIEVQNNLRGAVIQNVEWGGIPVASQLAPGEKSTKIKLYNDRYYDLKLPEKRPVKFFINVNGDKVYVETIEVYELGKEAHLFVEINDQTPVFNPLVGSR